LGKIEKGKRRNKSRRILSTKEALPTEMQAHMKRRGSKGGTKKTLFRLGTASEKKRR